MKKKNSLNSTPKYVLLFGIVLLVANIALGIVNLNQSADAMRTQVRKNMYSIVSAAAGMVDGDILGSITAEDVEAKNEKYQAITKTLLFVQESFKDSAEIKFIYALRHKEGDEYEFTVDPDPVSPAYFGQPVKKSAALFSAGKGFTAVDEKRVEDEWGNYFSAYSPVFDSEGKPAGIIGVDFDEQWYRSQIRDYIISIAVISGLIVIFGLIVIVLITLRVYNKVNALNKEMNTLSSDIDRVTKEAESLFGYLPGETAPETLAEDADEMEVLGSKIHTMQSNMLKYMDSLHQQAYTDTLTKVGNSTAYHEAILALDEKIRRGRADFTIIVFDINGLKELNDRLGHEAGDHYIRGAGETLLQAFDPKTVYRIGGDEFAVVAEDMTEEEAKDRLAVVNAALQAFNFQENHYGSPLLMSSGIARYDERKDMNYRTVFARADQHMYAEKKRFYEAAGRPDVAERIESDSDAGEQKNASIEEES